MELLKAEGTVYWSLIVLKLFGQSRQIFGKVPLVLISELKSVF